MGGRANVAEKAVSLEAAVDWVGAKGLHRPASGDPGIRRRDTEMSTCGLN